MLRADPYARLAGVYDEIVVDPCHGRWAAYLDEVWSGDADGVRSVLDVCCGTGLMASALVALGHRVVGVDSSPAMLDRARGLLGPDVVLLRQTLPGLTVDGPFDAAVSTFDGLNYLAPAELRATFAALAVRIRPGGWLAFDIHTDAMMDLTVANGTVEGSAQGYRFTIENVVDVPARTCDSRVEITRLADGDRFSEHHHQHFFADRLVQEALASCGFTLASVTDEYTDTPADATTLRATWIARRRPVPPGDR